MLWDIDGTLLNSSGAGVRAMRAAAAQLFGSRFTFDGVEFSGNLDPNIFVQAGRLNQIHDTESHLESFRRVYLEKLGGALAAGSARACPGVHATLAELRRRAGVDHGCGLGLLTGNFGEAAALKLAAVNIEREWFTITAFGDEAPNRLDLAALAIRRYADHVGRPVDPSGVVVIGDTPRDIECAKANGCVAFAVATGSHGVEQLRDAGADVAVEDLSDPAPLLELVP